MKSLESKLEAVREKTSGIRVRNLSNKFFIDSSVVLDFLKMGLNMKQIGTVYGCSSQTVAYQVRKDYPDFDAREYVRWGKTEISDENLTKLYRELKSCAKVGKVVGMTRTGVDYRLKKMGVKLNQVRRDDVTVAKVIRFYKKYKKTSVVARLLGTSVVTVRERLREGGVELDTEYRHERKRIDIDEGEVLRRYDKGESMDAIARNKGANGMTIRRILDRHNRKIRERGHYQRNEDITVDIVVELFNELKKVTYVAKKLGVGTCLVYDRLDQAGIKRALDK
jgi:DNA invertase Pin-like site-specific DNA recombinase